MSHVRAQRGVENCAWQQQQQQQPPPRRRRLRVFDDAVAGPEAGARG